MQQFSPSDAALEGFRLTREHPFAILAWSGVYFAGIILMALVMMVGIGPEFGAILRNSGGNGVQEEQLAALLLQSWPAFLIVILVLAAAIFLYSIITAGIYRIVSHDQSHGFIYLKLGADEARMALAHTTMWLIGIPLGIPWLIGLGGLLQAVSRFQGFTTVALAFVVCVVLSIPFVWVGVRLCLLTPLAFDRRKILIRDAWNLSKGHFWSLFGMLAMAMVFYLMVTFLLTAINLSLVAATGLTNLGEALKTINGVALVTITLSFVIQLTLPVLQIVLLYSPMAVAYQQIIAAVEAPAES